MSNGFLLQACQLDLSPQIVSNKLPHWM